MPYCAIEVGFKKIPFDRKPRLDSIKDKAVALAEKKYKQ